VAEAGEGRDAAGPGAESEPGQGTGAISTPAGDAGEEAPDASDKHGAEQAGKDIIEGTGSKESGDTVQGCESRRGSLAEN